MSSQILENNILRGIFTDLDINDWADDAAKHLLAREKEDLIVLPRLRIDLGDMLDQLKIELRNVVAEERKTACTDHEMDCFASHYLSLWFAYQTLKAYKYENGNCIRSVHEVKTIRDAYARRLCGVGAE